MRAPYACEPQKSRGRFFKEAESHFRTCFQRDRDRIIHSTAFRRLKHKTQVFVEHEGDHYRTRLTHSLEVAQVARTIARHLGLDQDLTETIALAHDLGHTPFGHTGEDALHEKMRAYGGFDHNAQTLRIVTSLERQYADFDGLNLTWESLEGLAKHNGPVCGELPYAVAECQKKQDFELATYASAEAQVAALSDDIAYNHHDILDGLRAGLISPDKLRELPLLDGCFHAVYTRYPELEWRRARHEILRRLFGLMVDDVIAETQRRLNAISPNSCDDIRQAQQNVVAFSETFKESLSVLRAFLFKNMYRAPRVVRVRETVAAAVADLFEVFMSDVTKLPRTWQIEVLEYENKEKTARHIADYIAGMTDRYALQQHERLCKNEV